MTDNMKHEKMLRLRQEIDIAKGVMIDTVDKLVNRAEWMNEIQEKMRDMRHQTQTFSSDANFT